MTLTGPTELLSTAPNPASAQPGTARAHVSLRDVTRVYARAGGGREVHALGPVSLDLRQGEFFAVVGPSGCGKSTLIDVIAGLARASVGSIEFEGRPVAGEVPEGVGVVFQEDACFPWLTVADNIAFGLQQAGLDAVERDPRVTHAQEDRLHQPALHQPGARHPPARAGGLEAR